MYSFFKNINRISLFGGLAIFGLSNSIYTVDGGQAAIIFNRFKGVQDNVVGEGTHFLIPFIQKPIIYQIRTQPYQMSSTTGSKDLQKVDVSLRVLYKPEVEQLPKIYSSYGIDYDQRILPSLGSEILKATVAQYDASELITQRELVSNSIRASLMKRAKDFNILFDDVSITHLAFSTEFTKAIEQKQVAQQEAEKAKYEVERQKQEKLAAIIRAEGESEAANLISLSMKNGNGFLELRRIEASKEIAENLSKSRNIIYVPSSVNMFINQRNN
eukprot:TRINITY_DN16995_c0_g1_i1.p1 TRINITY_DN16995_c0_g1~~TRINITY_DN16995_c0_g1_i1.p1  ORF type:complete len:272 (+),score=78.36 TRINITY_DN16995_c0_g1_i1:39-854(+)